MKNSKDWKKLKLIQLWTRPKSSSRATGKTGCQASQIEHTEFFKNVVSPYTHVHYSFLTLDQHPNVTKKYWDAQNIYDSGVGAPLMDVMKVVEPRYKNPYEFQRRKIVGLIDAVHANGGKFIWGLGGWSDLTQTLKSTDVDVFVSKVVEILKKYGDGIDFDWEHLSDIPKDRNE